MAKQGSKSGIWMVLEINFLLIIHPQIYHCIIYGLVEGSFLGRLREGVGAC